MQLSTEQLSQLCGLATEAAEEASALIAATPYDSLKVDRKAGMSSAASEVVSQLDRDAQERILKRLADSVRQFDLGVLAEESADAGSRFHSEAFWAIDPLDGTLPFLSGKAGYACSIALVDRSGIPWLGVVANPRTEDLYQAIRGQGASLNGKALHAQEQGRRLCVFTDPSMLSNPFFLELRPRLEALARELNLEGLAQQEPAGAVMNVCQLIQQGPALYVKAPKPQPGGGSIWDYAASACIAQEAGAMASDLFGQPLDLNRTDSSFMNHRGVLFASSPELHQRCRERLPTL